MVYDYVNVTGDTSILQRALPLAEVSSLLRLWSTDPKYLYRLSLPGGQIIVQLKLRAHTPTRPT
jgi:hypothetical protein